MHIPDGYLDAKTAVAGALLSAGGVGFALRQVRKHLSPARIPLLGLAAAFIFASQMLNFPVLAGTSGHLIGGVLAAVLLGPSAAVVVMTAVAILQCLLFADGGVTALGPNIFNMALVAPGVGYAIYRGMRRCGGQSLRAQLLATAFAAWCSTVAASVCCAAQLALSGTVAWSLGLPAMLGVHMLIGAGEALITTLVVAAIARARPELLSESAQPHLQPRTKELAAFGLLLSVGMVVFVAPRACRWPDGLERVAEKLGFEHHALAQPVLSAPLPDYSWPSLGSAGVGTVVAGLVGTGLAFALAYLLAVALTRNRQSPLTGGQ